MIFTILAAAALIAHLVFCAVVISRDLAEGRVRYAVAGIATTIGALIALGWWFFLLGLAGSGV
jgi:hypothetical protein